MYTRKNDYTEISSLFAELHNHTEVHGIRGTFNRRMIIDCNFLIQSKEPKDTSPWMHRKLLITVVDFFLNGYSYDKVQPSVLSMPRTDKCWRVINYQVIDSRRLPR